VPCAQSVPHLNELQEKFGAQGLSIIGVTNESASETVPWIEDKQAKYAFAYDKSGKVHRFFGVFVVTGIPHAVLLAPDGTVAWRGHPGSLDEETIQASLAGALTKPLFEWPASAKGVAQSLVKGDFAGAVAKAAKVPEADGGAQIAAQVQAILEGHLKAAEAALAAGNLYDAIERGEQLAKGTEGLPQQERAKKIAADANAHPDAKRILEGQKAVRKLRSKELSKRKDQEKALEDLKQLATDFRGTYAAVEAEALMAQVREMLKK